MSTHFSCFAGEVDVPVNRTPPPAITPGGVLRSILDQQNMSQESLADLLGVSRISVSQLVNDRRTFTADMAVRLEAVLGLSAEFWLNLQMSADINEARKKNLPEKR